VRVLIVGAGRVGSELAKRLSEAGHSVTVVDKDKEKVDAINEEADVEGIEGDITNPTFYHKVLDLAMYDAIIAVTDRDEVNLFIAAMAKIRGVRGIYVRVRTTETLQILESLGIHDVVVEPMVVANLLYSMIEGKQAPVILAQSLTGDYQIVSAVVRKYSNARGRRLYEVLKAADLIDKVKVIGIYDGTAILDPEEVEVLEEGYIVIMLARSDAIEKISEVF
jgi:trk system potassium uptake protein TrkA